MKAHIDLDLVVYSVGSACEGTYWVYKGREYESKRLLNLELKDDGVDDSAIVKLNRPEPWEKVRDSVNSYVEGIIESTGTDDYQGYISGKGNFRYGVATIKQYKGNRTSLSKPAHYDAIRQYLVDVYDAKTSVDMEADDLIGLSHDPEEDMICTLDKDLNCIPGLHYNWTNGLCQYITEHQANKYFYSQVLTGDDTDNIPGLYGVGAKSKLVESVWGCGTEEDMMKLVTDEYEKRFGSYWKQFFLENCKLLWILQSRKPLWESLV